jgi:hypothetical protein
MTILPDKEKVYISPFSMQHENILNWNFTSSKEIPLKNGLLNVPPSIVSLVKDLAVIGVIGSSQCKRLYVRSNSAARISKALDLGLLKKHELIRGKQIIPLYTLGPTGMYLAGMDYEQNANYWKLFSIQDVLQRLVFFQMYGQMKDLSEMVVSEAEDPFISGLKINDNSFHILVLRGNESIVENYFKYETEIPDRIILIAEGINHILPVQSILTPFADRIRLTTDDRLKMPFEDMFYYFNHNAWVLENS